MTDPPALEDYADVPALCPNGHAVLGAIQLIAGIAHMEADNGRAICPVCGEEAPIPNGVYSYVDGVPKAVPADRESRRAWRSLKGKVPDLRVWVVVLDGDADDSA